MRRELLTGGVGAAAVVASDCLAELSDVRDRETGDEGVRCPDTDFRRAEGDPIEVRERFDDDPDVRYVENGTVEYRIGQQRGDPIYETVPFEEWGNASARRSAGTPPSIGPSKPMEMERRRGGLNHETAALRSVRETSS